MGKKQDSKKTKKAEVELAPDELSELQMILDRLSVQSPEGESLANYIESLRTALRGRDRMITALVERLGSKPSEVGFRTLMGLRDLVEEKKYRRLIKQVVYRFEQKGFAAEKEGAREETVVLVQSEVREPLAHFVPTDDVFWLLTAIIYEPGRLDPLAISAFPDGAFDRLSVKTSVSSHKHYREYINSVASNIARPMREVPVWHVARLFRELLELCRAAEPAAQVERAKRALQPYDDPQRPPYAYELMTPVDPSFERLSAIDTHKLLDNVAFDWLAFTKEELLPYWRKIQDMEASVLVVARDIQEQRMQQVVRDALDELCTGKVRFLWQRFFEEYAMWFELSGDYELAEWSWLVARHLAEGKRVSDDPVSRLMLGSFLHKHWEKEMDRAERAKKDPFCKTDSGLIVPC